jgi:hypothetical protein
MRPQHRYVLDALLAARKGGSLDLDARFLTLEDLLDCIRRAAELLGFTNRDINRHTVETWIRSGILGEQTPRPLRNRLYSGVDVVRLLAVWSLTHLGITPKVGKLISDELIEALGTQAFHRLVRLEPSLKLDERDLIWVVPGGLDGGLTVRGIGHKPASDGTPKRLAVSLQSHGAAVLVNASVICSFAVATVGERCDQKVRQWKERLEDLRSQGKLK